MSVLGGRLPGNLLHRVLITRYRRSYDSEYTAPLVNHHIWPSLMQGVRVVVKGESNTRRGASLVSLPWINVLKLWASSFFFLLVFLFQILFQGLCGMYIQKQL